MHKSREGRKTDRLPRTRTRDVQSNAIYPLNEWSTSSSPGRFARLLATEKDKCMRLCPYFPGIHGVLDKFGSFVYENRIGARVSIANVRKNDRNASLEKKKRLPLIVDFFLSHP